MSPTSEPKKKSLRKRSYRPKIQPERTFKRCAAPDTPKQVLKRRNPRRKAASKPEVLVTDQKETPKLRTPKKRCMRRKKAPEEGVSVVDMETVIDPTGGSKDVGGSCMESPTLCGEGCVVAMISWECQKMGAKHEADGSPKLVTPEQKPVQRCYTRRSAMNATSSCRRSLNFMVSEAEADEKSTPLHESRTEYHYGSMVEGAAKPVTTTSENVGIDVGISALNQESLDFMVSKAETGEKSTLLHEIRTECQYGSMVEGASKPVTTTSENVGIDVGISALNQESLNAMVSEAKTGVKSTLLHVIRTDCQYGHMVEGASKKPVIATSENVGIDVGSSALNQESLNFMVSEAETGEKSTLLHEIRTECQYGSMVEGVSKPVTTASENVGIDVGIGALNQESLNAMVSEAETGVKSTLLHVIRTDFQYGHMVEGVSKKPVTTTSENVGMDVEISDFDQGEETSCKKFLDFESEIKPVESSVVSKTYSRKIMVEGTLKPVTIASENVGIDVGTSALNLDEETSCKKILDFESEILPVESSVVLKTYSRKTKAECPKNNLKRKCSKAISDCPAVRYQNVAKRQRSLGRRKRVMRNGHLGHMVRLPNAIKKQRTLRGTKRGMRKHVDQEALLGEGNSDGVSLEFSLAIGGGTYSHSPCDAKIYLRKSISDEEVEHKMLEDKHVGERLVEESNYIQPSIETREQQFLSPNTSLTLPESGQLGSDELVGSLALSLWSVDGTNTVASAEPHNEIVVFREDRLVRKPFRPKVVLDQETIRMWKLLAQNEETDEMDSEQEKYWREERQTAKFRIEKFLACMHCVQGDRSFSKWKGSVLDSIIGVYLTQNVSDYLSSNAFIALASRFPPQCKASSAEPYEERSSKSGEEKEIGKSLDQNSYKEIECEDMYGERETENKIESSCRDKGSGAHNNLKEKLIDICHDVQALSQESEGTSVKTPLQLEQHAGNCNISTVGEGWTLVSKEKNGMSKTNEIVSKYESSHAKVGYTQTVKSSHAEEGYTRTVNVRLKVQNKKDGNQYKEKEKVDWDSLRRDAFCNNIKQKRSIETLDSLDYEALRDANVEDIADTIKMRGMNNRLAERIKAFLQKLMDLHGSMDLEWLRFIPPDKVKDYLLQFNGLGLKSVECVRLLCLQHQAFPVDTNVARVSVRLGWVPLQPLPAFVQIHVLDQFPIMEKIQAYLWPRLCKLDPQTLYELHYQMITFGKVFCTKRKPNCQACPFKEDCRHYASKCASEKLALPSSQEKHTEPTDLERGHGALICASLLAIPERNTQPQAETGLNNFYVTLPASPVSESSACESAMDDQPWVDGNSPLEIVIECSPQNVGTQESSVNLEEEDIPDIEDFPQVNRIDLRALNSSKALIASTPNYSSRPVLKMRNLDRLRTEHLVYELPDKHPLLAEFEQRVDGDPCPYLLAIWSPGETADSIQLPITACNFRESGNMCDNVTCFPCNAVREANTQRVRGTLLIPCRTAMRGSFPLNGTYFQNNEVFADDETSKQPIDVPTDLVWDLPRSIAYFGSSVSSIFDDLLLDKVQHIFSRGYVCTRGFERTSRAPRDLQFRFHCPRSKRPPAKKEEKSPRN